MSDFVGVMIGGVNMKLLGIAPFERREEVDDVEPSACQLINDAAMLRFKGIIVERLQQWPDHHGKAHFTFLGHGTHRLNELERLFDLWALKVSIGRSVHLDGLLVNTPRHNPLTRPKCER
jgi:hypothetical protein